MIWSTLALLLMGVAEAKPIPDAEYKLKLDPYKWVANYVSV